MAQLTVSLILLISCCVCKGNFQVCEIDATKVQEENRKCADPCSTSRCVNTAARCLCDGACGFSCIPPGLTCRPPGGIKYGSVIALGDFEFAAEIQYECVVGYDLIGADKRSCRGDAEWSGEDPFCTKSGVRCRAPTFEITNAHLVNERIEKDDYFEGEQVIYICETGYYNVRDNVHVSTCEVVGEEAYWSPISSNCVPKICPKPEKIKHGYYEGTDFSFGKSVIYSCDPGYNLFGVNSLLCMGDEWSSSAPECQPVTCSKPTSLRRGTVEYEEPSKYRASAWYKCDSGFVLFGDRVRICGEDGEWSGKETQCLEAKCEEPPVPKNGYIRNHSGNAVNDRVEYGCFPYTTRNGTMSAICTVDADTAKWSVPPPVCTLNCNCSEMNLDKSLKIMGNCDGEVENGKKFTLDCAPDYDNITGGSRIVECRGGQWDIPTTTNCEAPCIIPEIKNGAVIVSIGRKFVLVHPQTKIGAGNEILIICVKGYTETESSVICADGKFPVIPRCKSIDVETTIITTTTGRYPRRTTTNSYQTATIALLQPSTQLLESSSENLTKISTIEEEFQTTESSILRNNCNGDCEKSSENGDLSGKYGNTDEVESDDAAITTTENPIQIPCIYEHEADKNLIAYQDEELLTSDVLLLPTQSVQFRCVDVSINLLIGTNHLICGDNGWLGRVPRCEVLSHRNPDKAPVVTYKILNGDSYIAPNGSLMISEDASMELDCWWFRQRHGEAKWFWNAEWDVNVPHVATSWQVNGNYVLRVDILKKGHEGVYSCVNPKRQEHAIDVRVIKRKIQPTSTSTIGTNQLTTTQLTLQTRRPTPTTTWSAKPMTTRTVKPPTTTTTKLTTTQQPPPVIKEEYLTDDCIAQSSKDLIIHENGVELQQEKLIFPSSTSLVFRCRYFYSQKIRGVNKVQCFKGRWSPSWPTCDNIYANNWNSPPPVAVTSDTPKLQLDNGDYLLPKGAHLHFLCFFYPVQPEMYINNVLARKNIQRNNGQRADDIYWLVNVGKYNSSAILTFKCYIPRGYKDEKYANSVTVRYGDHCFLPDEGKKELLLRFPSVVILPSSLRTMYAEGDIVNFGCNKTVARGSYIPEGIRCAENGIWEIQSRKQTHCD